LSAGIFPTLEDAAAIPTQQDVVTGLAVEDIAAAFGVAINGVRDI